MTRRARHLSRPSPLRNRCAPDGSLQAVAARGTLMGNRGGRLHRADFTLGRARWKSRAWIACRLDFKGRRRAVMGESYTEIFFLDEATALAAGHRPCFECRHDEARAFAAAWARAHGTSSAPSAPEMDRILHAQRLGTNDVVAFAELAPGAIFSSAGAFHLRTPSGSALWTFDGYRTSIRQHHRYDPVEAITPAAIRALLPELSVQRALYGVGSHPQANPSPSGSSP